ncbi:major facilitator superfamily transporter [Stachybotrys elegans]|uniref:Major facilitator superfamily transporter n=1 Tax=Stachybotrys elegans TaxID=80388 RepID=A0A8K0SNP0_9HYPO|nr:major facilitator superfamily transporter [Stachybotrys elegans]
MLGQLEQTDETTWSWEQDPANPHNWTPRKKVLQIIAAAAAAFTASIGTSLVSPARGQIQQEFDVTRTQSILPLSLYVFALGLGPVVGGPLSETVGRLPVYLGSVPLGAIFTLGAGFTHNFGALCFLRFMAGFAFSPSLAIGAATISDVYIPAHRGVPATIFILMPFLGPGFGPLIGAFVTTNRGWRWTQWTLIFFAIFAFIASLGASETHHPVLKRRRAKQLGQPIPPTPPISKMLSMFATVALVRPIVMLLTEPIVTWVCLYASCEFGTLFSFFAAVPYVFTTVYGFNTNEQGLVFISIIVGCLFGALTIVLCNVFLYLPKTKNQPPHQTFPEYRLYPAMIGSIGLPIALFWFGWTARPDVHWASPVVAIMPFAWGNICIFIATVQYMVDSYSGLTVASASSANSLSRYIFAGAFPLFAVQMNEALGIDWASSLLAFVALALLPVPWIFYKWGPAIRKRSKFV